MLVHLDDVCLLTYSVRESLRTCKLISEEEFKNHGNFKSFCWPTAKSHYGNLTRALGETTDKDIMWQQATGKANLKNTKLTDGTKLQHSCIFNLIMFHII